MKYGMRERVSGTVIVIAVAIIVLPMLFDRSDDDSAASRGTSMSIDQPVEVEQRNVGAPESPLADDSTSNRQRDGTTTRQPSQSNQLFPGRSSDESSEGESVTEEVARSNEPQPDADEAAAPGSGERQTQSAPAAPRSEQRSGSSGGEDPIMAAASRGSGSSAAGGSRGGASGGGVPSASAGGWALQAGSFGQSANAERLVGQLREQGFSAWQQPRGELNTVFIGPFDSREAGERAAGQLQQRAGINGFVVERGAGQ